MRRPRKSRIVPLYLSGTMYTVSPIPHNRPLILRRRLSTGEVVTLSNAELMSSICGIVGIQWFDVELSGV